MRQYLSLALTGAALAGPCVAQPVWPTLSSNTPNTTQSIQATREIALMPGFSTAPSAQQEFSAVIVPVLSQVGQWSSPSLWRNYMLNNTGGNDPSGCIGIHTSVLPNGKVLTWQGHNDDVWTNTGALHRGTDAYIWDPTIWDPDLPVAERTSINKGFFLGLPSQAIHFDESNAFCTGHSFLPDGKLLVTGGHSHTQDPQDPDYDPLYPGAIISIQAPSSASITPARTASRIMISR